MEKLFIEATKSTPTINFNPQEKYFEIAGQSRPENVSEFFDPIMNWLKEYSYEVSAATATTESPLTFEFKFDYFNSASSKYVLDILKKIKEYQTVGARIEVYWYVEEGDEDIQAAGEEMSKIVKLPFIFMENLDEL
ncbi:MAG: DUF1987 domain-containing protein [Bacteroidetes bacterium]|nr:DUF1987 domain-containing protein [Bacteroidota bacterium]MBU1718221.1 DUF1987 domain-containing protein [Bacteroidota bacterium]